MIEDVFNLYAEGDVLIMKQKSHDYQPEGINIRLERVMIEFLIRLDLHELSIVQFYVLLIIFRDL